MTRKTYCGNLLWQSGLTLLAPMRAVLGIPATPAPREKAAARFREEMEKRRAALKSAR